MLVAILAASFIYQAEAIRVIDGDTLKVSVAGWPEPFTPIGVRVYGIDTPEHVKPPAKTKCEVALGLKAKAFAMTLVKPGDKLTLTYTAGLHDKYGRLLATVTLADGSDFGADMIAAKLARAYGLNGSLHKGKWC